MLQKRFLFLWIVLYAITGNRCTDKISPYNKKWFTYLNEAKEENKYLILEFSTTWCMPCKVLETNVLQNDSVVNYLKPKAILLSLDAEKNMGLALAMKYGITTYPTLLIFNSSQNLIYEKIGIDGIDNVSLFIDFMKSIFNDKNILPAKALTHEIPSSSSYPKFYTQYFINKREPDSITIANYFKKQSDLFSEINWTVIRVFGNDTIQNFVTKNASKFINLYGCMVESRFAEKVHSSLNNDFRTKDSTQFKKDVVAFIKLKENMTKKQLMYREYLIKLNFWGQTGLNWNDFLSCWKTYRSAYGTDLDVAAAKLINVHYKKQDLRELAEYILQQGIKRNPHDWKNMVGLANLLERDGLLQPDKEGLLIIHSNLSGIDKPDADSLYEQAIKEAKGNKEIISLIVGSRLNAAQYISNEEGWQKAMKFFKKYLPKAYASFHNAETATYYEKQHKWVQFVAFANKRFKQMFIETNDNSEQVNEVNAHLMYNYANTLYKNSRDANQIKIAIYWMDYLSKKYPENTIYKEEEELLEKRIQLKIE